MTRDEALKLHKELSDMVGECPGELYGMQHRIKQIEFAFQGITGVTTYFDEKVYHAIHWLQIWRSPRKWQQWGADHMLNNVRSSLWQMRSVIEQQLKDAPSDPAKVQTATRN